LPSGYTYGRMDARSSDAVLSAATSGKVVLDQCRGRSSWSRPGQAAEIAVREAIGEYLLDALHVEPHRGDRGHGEGEHGDVMRVTHRDGRQWAVTVRERELDPARQNSCGKAAVRPIAFVAESMRPLPGSTEPMDVTDRSEQTPS
jgi:hypothetical protein